MGVYKVTMVYSDGFRGCETKEEIIKACSREDAKKEMVKIHKDLVKKLLTWSEIDFHVTKLDDVFLEVF